MNTYNYGINVNTLNLFNSPLKICSENNSLKNIELFTMGLVHKNSFQKKQIKSIKKENNNLYSYEDIKFTKISNYVSDNIRFQELETYNRYGTCFQSINRQKYIKDSSIVVGYIESDSYKFLHSWLEKNDKVIDYTKNLIISKDDYYKLLNVTVINRINDLKYRHLDILPIGIYLTFSKEIESDLAKNKQLLKKNKAIVK